MSNLFTKILVICFLEMLTLVLHLFLSGRGIIIPNIVSLGETSYLVFTHHCGAEVVSFVAALLC